MKRMIMSAIVEEKEVIGLSDKITKLIEAKKGKVNIHVTGAPPQGSGLTLGGV